MTSSKSNAISRQLEQLWTSGTLTGLNDAQLLGRFAEARGRDATAESAFQELIHRHGSMVLGVCRQILRHPHDADDAFQATFLVLVRKARSIRVGDSLAPWLYGVAYRTAHRARAVAARYRPAGVEPIEEPMEPSSDDVYQLDVRPLLHEELNRLPGKYRDPIVLCHLEGKTHEEAARLLSWPVGTVSGRLSRGRQILKSRLERRGVTVSSAMLSANWLAGTPATVTLPLIESTLNAAFRLGAVTAVSTSVLSLTQGVLRTMLLNKLKMTALIVLVTGGITGGIGAWAYRASGSASPPVQDSQPAPAKESPKPTVAAPASKPSANPRPSATGAPRAAWKPQPGVRGGMSSSEALPGQFGGMGTRMGGGMGGAMGRSPFDGSLHMLQSQSIIVVQSPDTTSWEAISLEGHNPTWSKVSFLPDVKVTPIIGPDILAMALQGTAIDHVAAFSKYTGQWSEQPLLKPVDGVIQPIVGPGSALYQAGNDFYAFSAQRGKWGVLHLEGEAKAGGTVSSNHIQVMQGNRLYVFGLKYGEWSPGVAVNLRPSRKAALPK